MRRRLKPTLWPILAAILLASAIPALAQDDPPPQPGDTVTDDEVNAVATQLFCPVCDNVPLDVCGSQACADWRAEIRSMLEAGRSEAEIKAYFAQRYGQRVLATPEAQGFNLLVWALPVAGLLLGLILLALALRRMAPGALAAGPDRDATLSYDDLDPEYLSRLERELKEFSS